MDRFTRQINFICEINKLKDIIRRSYLPDSLRLENDAEHSWHLALMAITFEDYKKPNTDINKVIKLVLIHDLVEIYAGDTYCFDETGYLDKSEREQKAASDLFNILEEDQAKYFIDLWYEFESCETEESIFANVLDRLEPFLLSLKTNYRGWKENNVTKAQILKRMDVPIKFGGVISKFVLEQIDLAQELGAIK